MIGLVPQDPFFKNQRRAALSRHATQIGIDYVKVEKESGQQAVWLLKLYFIAAATDVSLLSRKPIYALRGSNNRAIFV
jgi:hypothetical protein